MEWLSRKCWLAHVKSLKKKLNLQDEALESNLIKKALDKREWEEFEMDVQHKLKLTVCKELNREVGLRNVCNL